MYIDIDIDLDTPKNEETFYRRRFYKLGCILHLATIVPHHFYQILISAEHAQ